MSKNKRIIEIVLLAVTALSVLASILWMFIGGTGDFAANGWEAFKYFTVDSNFLLGVTSVIALIELIRSLRHDTPYPRWAVILQLCGVAGTTLTFATVICYLAPLVGFERLIMGPNLLMHIITPVIGIVSFCAFFERDAIRFREVPFAVLPMVIYGIGYLINIAVNNGYGDKDYDWYMFGQWGIGIGIAVYLLMVVITFALSVLLWIPARKKRQQNI